jgi:hypothetical protein
MSYTVVKENPFWATCDLCGKRFKIDHWQEHNALHEEYGVLVEL